MVAWSLSPYWRKENKTMSTNDLSLVASTPVELPGGLYFALLDTQAAVDIYFLGKNGRVLEKCLGVRAFLAKEFDEVNRCIAIKFESDSNQTIKYDVSEISVLSSTRIDGAIDAEIQPPDTVATVADVTVTAGAAAASVLAQNSARKKALISSPTTNSQLIRIGDSNIGASRGTPLLQGQSIELETSAAIYAYTASGTNQTLNISYTEQS